MIRRERELHRLEKHLSFSPIVAVLGPRQSGKTTLAKSVRSDHFFDLENPRDLVRLENAQTVLEKLKGRVVIDEIQRRPELFPLLRYLVDQNDQTQYLILGSASRDLIRQGNETLAGRIVYQNIHGFSVDEIGGEDWRSLWWRGGYPRSYLAEDDEISGIWRDNYISTFLERDLFQYGVRTSPSVMRRFWIMLSHYNANLVNYSELGRSLQVADTTIRQYMDLLESTFMINVLRPWFSNTSKRLVKRPKIYLRDSGIFHRLQMIQDRESLDSHPKLGASFESFVLEQILSIAPLSRENFYFWNTQSGAELDLFWQMNGKNFAIEIKYSDAPRRTRSMTTAIQDLDITHLWIIYPGKTSYSIDEKVSVMSVEELGLFWEKNF